MHQPVDTDERTSLDADTQLRSVGDVPGLFAYLRNAWRYRDFAVSLAVADSRAKHVDTVFGNLWQLLNPILLVAVYYLIFGVIFDVTRGVDNYLGFLVVGVFIFTFIRKSTGSGARAVLNNRSLIQTIRFPRVVLPSSTTLAELITFLPSLVVIVAVVLLTGEPVRVAWVLLLPLIVLLSLFNIGLAIAASRFTVHFRDLEEMLPFMLRMWFYLSGVLYPVSRVGEALGGGWQTVFEVNPAHVYIEIGRRLLLGGSPGWELWAGAIAWGVGVSLVSLVFFRRHELEYGDV